MTIYVGLVTRYEGSSGGNEVAVSPPQRHMAGRHFPWTGLLFSFYIFFFMVIEPSMNGGRHNARAEPHPESVVDLRGSIFENVFIYLFFF